MVSRPIYIPPDLDRDGLETHRVGVEQVLNHLSDDAERWALEGGRRRGDCSVRPEVSRVSKWSTPLKGPQGITLAEEFDRLEIAPGIHQKLFKATG